MKSNLKKGVLGVCAALAVVCGIKIVSVALPIIEYVVTEGAEMMIKKDPQAEAIEYMENKYDEKFTMKYYGSDTYASSGTQMAMQSESHPEWTISVERDKKSGRFSDNYAAFFMVEKVEKYFYDIIQPIYGECKVFYSIGTSTQGSGLSKDCLVEDFIFFSQIDLSIFVNKDPTTKEDDLTKLVAAYKEKNVRPISNYILYMDQEHLDAATAGNSLNYFSDRSYSWRCDAVLNTSIELISPEWEEGRL